MKHGHMHGEFADLHRLWRVSHQPRSGGTLSLGADLSVPGGHGPSEIASDVCGLLIGTQEVWLHRASCQNGCTPVYDQIWISVCYTMHVRKKEI